MFPPVISVMYLAGQTYSFAGHVKNIKNTEMGRC